MATKRYFALCRHPIFPALVFTFACLATGEFYPFSPYSMFSNPDPRPLHYCYLTDGEGEPLPTLWHTGVSPASISKKFNTHQSRFEGTPREGAEGLRIAGIEVLNWLRDLSLKRKNRELSHPIRLVRVAIRAGKDGKLTEEETVVAELGALEEREEK